MAPMIRTIGNYATQEKYSVDFFGEELIVTVTTDPSVIGQWIHDVFSSHRFSSHPHVVGLGVQWTPACYYSHSPPASDRSDSSPVRYLSDSPPVSYRSDSSPVSYQSDSSPVRYRSDSPPAFYPPADTLQLCVGNRCIIIQLSHCHRVPLVLRRFLTDPDYRFYGIWNSQDGKRLERSDHQLDTAGLLDLRKLVVDSRGRKSLKRRKFEVIVEVGLGYQGVGQYRGESMSNWSVKDLSYDQIIQASVDAFCCFKLGVQVGTYPSE